MNLLLHTRMSLANMLATFLFLVAAPGLSGQSPAPERASILSTKEEVQASLNKVPCERSARLEGVKQLFISLGAAETDLNIEKFDKDKISNLVVRKKGETDETIVVGAHYDRTDEGCGATDNWSGITIMAHLYKTILPLKTKKSYIFVAFDQEEKGLLGSRQMLKAMTKPDIAQICSMVNFDSFGQAYPMALKNASSSKMLKLAETLGKESGFTFNSVDIPGASSDSAAFIEKRLPAITLSGLGGNWTEILHTRNDKLDKVNIDSVYLGYRFGSLYVSKLDAGACGDFK
jgi:Zn-dependent M28 family amino/carboxypeptidase